MLEPSLRATSATTEENQKVRARYSPVISYQPCNALTENQQKARQHHKQQEATQKQNKPSRI